MGMDGESRNNKATWGFELWNSKFVKRLQKWTTISLLERKDCSDILVTRLDSAMDRIEVIALLHLRNRLL